MGNAILANQGSRKQIDGKDITYIAGESLKIGDVVYTIEGEDIQGTNESYLSNLDYTVWSCAFSPNGNTLVLGGQFIGYAKVYSVSGTTITYVSDIYADSRTTALDSTVRSCAFSPNGNTLVLGGDFTGKAKIYSVSGTTVTYVSDIYADSGATALNNIVWSFAFSPNGSTLVLGGDFTGKAKVYSVSGTTITYVSNIYANSGTTALDYYVYSCTFSPNGSTLVLGGDFTGYAKIYSVSGTTVTYVSDIYADNGTTALSSYVNSCVFSPNGSTLILGGQFTGRAKIYSVSGTTITYVSDIYADSGTTILSSAVWSCAFSPNGSALVLGGDFTGRAKIYSVSGTAITYVSDIYADIGTTALGSTVRSCVFSPNGSTLVLGGQFTRYAKVYSVLNTTITYVSDIYADSGTTALSGSVRSCAFSPNGSALVLGGDFTGYAKVYSVSGTTITYVSDIYADSGTTALDNTIYSCAFSPNGNTLVLGGQFIGYAKVYSVSGTAITYVSNIYADSGTTALSSTVRSCAFSPNGSMLVLGGDFTGRAKVYSVSGTTITFISNIYADSGTTALNNAVRSCIFSPNGNTLILSGQFTGYAKVYSVSGTIITYISNIYANSGTTALDYYVYSCAFSPNGSTLVLGGLFTGYAKIYSVSGTTVTYVSDIYADSGTTALDYYVYSCAFSPNGSTLILGGTFTGRAKVYSVLGTTITYVSNIYADSGTTVLTNIVYSCAFSPNGNTLVLGGQFIGYAKVYIASTSSGYIYNSDIYASDEPWVLSNTVYSCTFSPNGSTLVLVGQFTGRAKIYSVSGTNITYISDIYADSGMTALNGTVYSCAFSPNGSTLVLGGGFSGFAKIYSVSGTNIAYISNIYADSGTIALNSTVYSCTFSPNGSTLVLGGAFTGYAKVYSVSGTNITYISDIYADSGMTALNNNVRSCAFSPNGNTLVLGGDFTGKAKIYSVSGTTVTYVSDIYADSGATALNNIVWSFAFSPNGSTLVLGGDFTGFAKIYSVSGTNITYISDIYADSGMTALNSTVNSCTFSPNGSTLVLGGSFAGRAKIYSVSGTNITYISDIYADSGTIALSSNVRSCVFSPNGSTLVLGGAFTGYAKVYSVSGTTITYGSNIYADNGSVTLNGSVWSCAFSPNGSTLVLGGVFSGYAKVYSVSGTTITYVSDIYANSGTTALSNAVSSIVFSPNGSTLVLGGLFTGYAKVYSVSGTTITFISNIYADSGTTALSGFVYSCIFSPDGSTLVLGGQFTGYAKVYSVLNTTITYVSDIYADSGTTALSGSVRSCAFSPNGSTLVLGGQFTGYAKIYSVSGTTITYISNIYADSGTTAINSTVYSCVFSPNGSMLVLGGDFTGRAKVYSVSGTTITFISNIYADSGTTALNSTVYSYTFSPNGSTLILGGTFTGRAKVYSVSGTTITFVSNIYADSGTTVLSNSVRSCVTSPNGDALVLGGDFIGYAKSYPFIIPFIKYSHLVYKYYYKDKLNESKIISRLPNIGISQGNGLFGDNVKVKVFTYK